MILHWNQLPLYYGEDLKIHEGRFNKASQTTYGLLAYHGFSKDDDRLGYSRVEPGGESIHAEKMLMVSKMWTDDIPATLDSFGQFSTPIVVTVALNRSPCHPRCVDLLCKQLNDLSDRFPIAVEQNRFILACRGTYEPTDTNKATKQSDLKKLHEAGWELCVLQIGGELSRNGEILMQGIQQINGRGFVRLYPPESE